MLVPLDELAPLCAAIDGLRLRAAWSFEGVELDLPDRAPDDPERIAGKLLFRDSPFSGWVQAHSRALARTPCASRGRPDLDGPGLRVTLAGQTRNGRRGAARARRRPRHHRLLQRGRHRRGRRRARPIEAELDAIDAEVTELDRRASVLEHQRAAYDAVATARFDDLDVEASDRASPSSRPAARRSCRPDDGLQVLERQIEELGEQLETTRRTRFELERASASSTRSTDASSTTRTWSPTARRRRRRRPHRGAEAAPCVGLPAPRPHPPTPRTSTGSPSPRTVWPSGCARRSATPSAELRRADDELTTVFRAYKLQWESPNLAPTPDSYGDFARILEEIRGTGWPGGAPSGGAGSPSGAARTWCRCWSRWPRRWRRSRTGSSRSTRSCAASSSAAPATASGSGCGGSRPPTSRSSSAT